jgi:hypothetical protein
LQSGRRWELYLEVTRSVFGTNHRGVTAPPNELIWGGAVTPRFCVSLGDQFGDDVGDDVGNDVGADCRWRR